MKVSASLANKDFDNLSQGTGFKSCLCHLTFVKKKKLSLIAIKYELAYQCIKFALTLSTLAFSPNGNCPMSQDVTHEVPHLIPTLSTQL